MTEVSFTMMKEQYELSTMTLDTLLDLNTYVSNLRMQAGEPLRSEIVAYAREINKWINTRAAERETALAADTSRAHLRQVVSPAGFEGEFDKLLASATREKMRRQ